MTSALKLNLIQCLLEAEQKECETEQNTHRLITLNLGFVRLWSAGVGLLGTDSLTHRSSVKCMAVTKTPPEMTLSK